MLHETKGIILFLVLFILLCHHLPFLFLLRIHDSLMCKIILFGLIKIKVQHGALNSMVTYFNQLNMKTKGIIYIFPFLIVTPNTF